MTAIRDGAEAAPLWQRALPFIALVPAAAAFRLGNAGSLSSVAIVLVTLAFVRSARKSTWALVHRSWWADILIAVAIGAAMAVFFDHAVDPLIERFVAPINLENFSNIRGNLPNFLVLLGLGFVFGGVVEETVFRGFVIGWGSSLFGDKAAWPLAILSSIAFGLAHWYQGIGGVLSAGLTGVVLAVVYLLNGRRLLVPMVIHMTFDGIGIVELYLGIIH